MCISLRRLTEVEQRIVMPQDQGRREVYFIKRKFHDQQNISAVWNELDSMHKNKLFTAWSRCITKNRKQECKAKKQWKSCKLKKSHKVT